MNLRGKVAIVTGASSGIGKAIALGLAGSGANIAVNCYKSEAAAEEVLLQINTMNRKAILIQGDVSREEEVARIVSQTLDTFGKIDVLVNNAGLRTITLFGVESCPVVSMKAKDWDRMMGVNLRGPFLMSKAVLPQMMKQRSGSIINISSSSIQKATPGRSAYSVSKRGLEGLTKILAKEVADCNIRVNSLAPGGTVDVDGKGGLPVEVIVPACIFLASDDSHDISGESFVATDWNKVKGINMGSDFNAAPADSLRSRYSR